MFVSRNTRTSLSDVRRMAPTTAVVMVVAGALGLGLAGTASAETAATVSLTVNGKTSSVTTQAPNVADLLDERDIRFDSNDILSPGPTTNISNGLDVDLTHAVQLTVVDDGERQQHIVTSNTVSGARNELNLPTASTAKRSAFTAYTSERTWFYTSEGDRLSADRKVREGTTAVVHDVRVAFPDKKIRVKHRVVKNRSKLVRSGAKRVYKEGRNGRKAVTYRRTFVDGQFESQRVAKAHWIKEPRRRVVRVGTGPNWIGLANCESGGNPNAVNPAGFYGLYQFSLSTWHSVGGKGNPTDYGYWEQTKRAWILFKASGRSPWPVCGRHL